jgi:hypothetical protein
MRYSFLTRPSVSLSTFTHMPSAIHIQQEETQVVDNNRCRNKVLELMPLRTPHDFTMISMSSDVSQG